MRGRAGKGKGDNGAAGDEYGERFNLSRALGAKTRNFFWAAQR
jgi:hypothetical protein